MYGSIQSPVVWSLDEVPWRIPESSGIRSRKGARVEPLIAGLCRTRRWRALRVAGNWSALEGIADQIRSLVGASVSGVGDICSSGNVEVLPGTRREDPIHLPVADHIIDNPLSR